MNLNDYRQRYADLYNKVNQAQQELNHELIATEKDFNKLYQRQQDIDKRWFVANLGFFLKHKKHFTSDFGLSQIIVDYIKNGRIDETYIQADEARELAILEKVEKELDAVRFDELKG